MRMKLSDFNYELPKELVAEYPNKNRDEARLMVIDRKDYSIKHRQFKDMIEYFDENDVIFNDEEKVFKYLPEFASKNMTLEIILDKTSIEVFVDEGRFTMVLPRSLETEYDGISIVPGDEDLTVKIKSLEVHEMKSIWE